MTMKKNDIVKAGTVAEFVEQINAADAEIVAKAGGFEFTRRELAVAFARVQHAENWKYPIDALVKLENEKAIAAVREAVIFYTGSVPEIVAVLGKGYRVTAAGYYMTIGS